MTIETPLLTALVAAAGAVLIAVIGLIASVHYRLGKLEEGQKSLAQEDAHTRELISHTQETLAQEDAHTREILTQEITHTRKMVVEGDAHTRELIAKTQEMMVQGDAQTRELVTHTRELIMQEIAALRERSDAQHAETMAAIQRLTDAFLSHSHDTDGTIRFSIPPPPAAPPEQQEA